MSSHDVTVSRDGKFWFIEIPGVGGTQARRLNEVDEMARDYISIVTGEPFDNVRVDVRIWASCILHARTRLPCCDEFPIRMCASRAGVCERPPPFPRGETYAVRRGDAAMKATWLDGRMTGVTIAFAGLVIVGGVLVFVGMGQRRTFEQFMRDGAQSSATGVASRVEVSGSFGDNVTRSEFAKVEFETADGRRIRAESKSPRSRGGYVSGERAPIVYDRSNPEILPVLSAPGRMPRRRR